MAFGRSVEVIQADVAFNVDLGQFRGDMGQVERVYEQTTGGMSADALRLSIAQEKVARAIKRTGPESLSTKQATLALRREMDALATSSGRAGRAVDGEARAVDRYSRSAQVGTGAARGLGRSIGFAAASFLGGAGLVYGLKSVLNAAKESELVLGQTKLAVRAAGLEWEQYGDQIETAIAKQSKLGFDDEALLKSFSVFVTRTKDVTQALELNALAVDVSRGRYIDLEAAQQIVLKASLGQAGQLKRLGIDVDKNATSMELLAKLTESYGGRAAGALGTATASQERMNVSLENAKEIIGSGLTPIVADLADQVSDYLDDAGRQEELQLRVNQAVKDGTAIARGLADGIDTIRKVTAPAVNALGGLENAAQAAFGLVLLRRIGLLRLGIRGIGLAAVTSGGQIAGMGAQASTAATGVGRLAGLARGLNVASVVGLATYVAAQALHEKFDEPNTITPEQLQDPATRKRIKEVIGAKGLAKLDAAYPSAGSTSRPDEGTRGRVNSGANYVPAPETKKPPRRTPAFNTDLSATRRGRGLLDAQARAGLDPSLTNDLAADRAIESYYRAGLATAKEGTKAYTQILAAYVSAHRQSQSTLEQINQEKETNRKAVADKREADAKRAKAAIDKAQRAQYLAAAATANKSPLMGLEYDPASGFYKSTKPKANASAGTIKAGEKGLSEADIARQVHDALASLHGVIGQFGSNFSGSTAQLETHAYAQTDLQRKQLEALERLGAGMWFPGSGYSQTQLGAAGIGSGF